MAKKFKSDPENYYKMSEPFESTDIANDAIGKFMEELSELRKKHNIRDVYVIIYDTAKLKEGDVGEFITTGNFGNQMNCLPMAAYAYGQEQSEHKERISKMISKKAE